MASISPFHYSKKHITKRCNFIVSEAYLPEHTPSSWHKSICIGGGKSTAGRPDDLACTSRRKKLIFDTNLASQMEIPFLIF